MTLTPTIDRRGWLATWAQGRRRLRKNAAPAIDLANGLTHHWPLTESSGTRYPLVGAVSLTDNNGVGVLTVDGRTGANFSAASSRYLACAGTLLRFQTPFTLAVWVRPTLAADVNLLSKDVSSGREFVIQAAAVSGNLSVYTWCSASGSFGNFTVPLNVWFHVGLTFDGTTLRLYNNGVESGNHTGTPTMTNTEFEVGARLYSGSRQFFTGQMADLRKWSRALSPAEMSALQTL